MKVLAILLIAGGLIISVYCLLCDHKAKKERLKRLAVAKARVSKRTRPVRAFTFSAGADKFTVLARSEKEAWEKVRRITDGKGGPVMRIIRK